MNTVKKSNELFGSMRHSTEEEKRCYEEMLNKLGHELVEIPTRCKDCECYWENYCHRNAYWETIYESDGEYDEYLMGIFDVEPDGFCSWGKPMTDDDNRI